MCRCNRYESRAIAWNITPTFYAYRILVQNRQNVIDATINHGNLRCIVTHFYQVKWPNRWLFLHYHFTYIYIHSSFFFFFIRINTLVREDKATSNSITIFSEASVKKEGNANGYYHVDGLISRKILRFISSWFKKYRKNKNGTGALSGP